MIPYITEIKKILEQARSKTYTAINSAMVEAYWKVGKRMVEEEQKGEERAVYGTGLIQQTSAELTKSLGRGFSETNIKNFRKFYLTFPDFDVIRQTPSAKLSWSHFQLIMRVNNEREKMY